MKTNSEWVSISDMMAGLMMVFLFIAVVFMNEIQKEQEKVQEVQEKVRVIAETYQDTQEQLNADLNREFKDDLAGWDAEILDNNIVRFNAPDVLFDTGDHDINNEFRRRLSDFFPRYIKILTGEKYKADIEEVRIEGHTSSRWDGAEGDADASYLNNMALSQKRAISVLDFSYGIIGKPEDKQWLIEKLRANGMSFSKLRYDKDGGENFDLSRRVEFRVLTKTEERIRKIIRQINQ